MEGFQNVIKAVKSVVKPKEHQRKKSLSYFTDESSCREQFVDVFMFVLMFFKKEPGKSFSRVSRGNVGETNKLRELMIFFAVL